MSDRDPAPRDIPLLNGTPAALEAPFTRIGSGRLGGKAQGLIFIRESIEAQIGPDRFPGLTIDIPPLTVVATDVFDAFMERNKLHEIALSDAPDDQIGNAFQRADLPREIVGDLEALIDQVHSPLAVRSSSLLEDDQFEPFAGVYQTKMTPNNQSDRAARLLRLSEAIKFVYASTYFRAAKNHIRATEKDLDHEKMAVIIQKAVGRAHNNRFYPEVSGVGRSFNFYPLGTIKPEEGVVNIVLGLGKTIMDGEVGWSYSPARPLSSPPFASAHDRLEGTQTKFWAVRLGPPPQRDPISEIEYLVQEHLGAAEDDGTLTHIASTYDNESNRLSPGTRASGPRVLDFAPLLVLEEYPLNEVVKTVLGVCEEQRGTPVEIEFAVTFPPPDTPGPARLGLLQVRPMVVSHERVEITGEELVKQNLLLASNHVMGNGTIDEIRDVVYVKPRSFDTRHTRTMATQLDQMNSQLMAEGRPYLLIGFGRWGTSDPWLGIPVQWGQICGAKVVIEATLPNMIIEPSQGSHFFHNITSFRVSYFYHYHGARPRIDWRWLDQQQTAAETEFLRHVRLEGPLLVKVDGRTGRGAIWYPEG
ncbi:MAG: PEP/pyruvate-binding domain-containing protein [Planctomycetota bacterium]|jgi:hypothetical protein